MAYKSWTKKEIKKMILLWESKTVEQICEEIGRNRSQVMGMAREIRRAGYDLPKKKVITKKRTLIEDVLKELGLK